MIFTPVREQFSKASISAKREESMMPSQAGEKLLTSSLMAMAAAGLEKGGGEQQLLSNTSWLLLEQSPASGSDQFQNTGTNTWPTSLSGLWYDNTYVLEAEFNYSPVADSNSTKARSKNTQITSRVGIAVYQRRQGVIPVPNWTHAGNVFLNYNTGRAWGNYEMTTPDNSVKAATCSDMGKAGDHNGYQGWKLTFTCEDDPNGGGTFTDYKMYHLNVKAEKVGDSSQVLEVDSSDLLVTIVPAEGS